MSSAIGSCDANHSRSSGVPGQMVDPRFFSATPPVRLSELLQTSYMAPLSEDRPDDPLIAGANTPDAAGPSEICLAFRTEFREALQETRAAAAVVSSRFADLVPESCVPVVSDRPMEHFAAILSQLYPGSPQADLEALAMAQPGTSSDALLEPGVVISTTALISAGAEIGSGSVIGPGTVIGPGVAIGRGCRIGANCIVTNACLGDHVVIGHGTVVGSPGFGHLPRADAPPVRIPQLGRVIIQSGVEIGAKCTLDRGALGDTVIGEHTRIDDQVHLAHNCQVGRCCQLSGQSAMSGSAILEDNVLVGGGGGILGPARVGQGAIVHARALVTRDVPAGSAVAGYPARAIGKWRREQANLARLTRGAAHGGSQE